MLDFEEYRSYDATGLAALVRDGEVTADELVATARARIEAVNPTINAVVADVDPDQTWTSAGSGTTGAGADDGPRPFEGVPFLLKDLHQDLAGHATSGGSRSLSGHVVNETATVVQRWLDAGLRVIGKTNTPEFGAKGITEPHLFGAARNPWHTDHTPGGSSGGSGSAVAAGIVPVAGASDGGGSIRIPASANGLFGLKVSRGLIPHGPGRGEPLGGTATDGVLSRSVRDSAAMLDVLVGPTDVSPYLPGELPGPGGFAAALAQEPGRLRIGVCTRSAINPDVHPEAKAAAAKAARLLEELGHDVTEIETPPVDDEQLAQSFLTTWFAYCAQQVEEAKRLTGCGDEGFEPDTLVMAALGRATTPVAFLDAVEARHEHVRRLAAFHDRYDLLLTPTTATPPPRVGAFDMPLPVQLLQKGLLTARAGGLLRHTPIVDQMIKQNLGWVPFTQLANLTGRPAMSVPLHRTHDGLPMGVQLVGRLGTDALLLQLAAQLEQAAPWDDVRATVEV
ncbi:MAG: amidase [Nocardioides sp.]|nr:amidase [Nocardioides sp.]